MRRVVGHSCGRQSMSNPRFQSTTEQAASLSRRQRSASCPCTHSRTLRILPTLRHARRMSMYARHLDTRAKQQDVNHSATVVFVHGLGDTAHGLVDIAHFLCMCVHAARRGVARPEVCARADAQVRAHAYLHARAHTRALLWAAPRRTANVGETCDKRCAASITSACSVQEPPTRQVCPAGTLLAT